MNNAKKLKIDTQFGGSFALCENSSGSKDCSSTKRCLLLYLSLGWCRGPYGIGLAPPHARSPSFKTMKKATVKKEGRKHVSLFCKATFLVFRIGIPFLLCLLVFDIRRTQSGKESISQSPRGRTLHV